MDVDVEPPPIEQPASSPPPTEQPTSDPPPAEQPTSGLPPTEQPTSSPPPADQPASSPNPAKDEPAPSIQAQLDALNAEWENDSDDASIAGSVHHDREEAATTLGRYICDMKNRTINHHPFKYWWSSKKRCAEELLSISELDFTRFLVENERVQEIWEEFRDRVPPTDDAVRGESFQSLFECIRDNDGANYTAALSSTLKKFSREDWTTRFYALIFNELRTRRDGFLNNAAGDTAALWAASYCVAKLIMAYNRDKVKKQGAVKSLTAKLLSTRRKQATAKKAKGTMRLIGPQRRVPSHTRPPKKSQPKEKPGAKPRTKGTKAAKSTMGVGPKPSHQPPLTEPVDDGVAPRSRQTTPDEPDEMDEPTREKTDYGALGTHELLSSFVAEQDEFEEQLRKKNAYRIERSRRDIEACMAELRNDPKRMRQYKQLSRSLRTATVALFNDFQHMDVEEQRLRVLKAMGGPSDLLQKPLDTFEKQANHDDADVSHALAAEDALEQEANEAQRRNRAVHLDLPTTSEAHRQTAKKWTSILNGEQFQPTNLKEACIEIEISDYRFKVIPHQNPNIKLRWWQVLDIWWNHEQVNGRVEGISGGITADQVGLGKTISMAGTILHVRMILWGFARSLRTDPHYAIRLH